LTVRSVPRYERENPLSNLKCLCKQNASSVKYTDVNLDCHSYICSRPCKLDLEGYR